MTLIEVLGPKENRSWKDVPAFKADVPKTPPPCIPIAKLYVDGNGYETEETLVRSARPLFITRVQIHDASLAKLNISFHEPRQC